MGASNKAGLPEWCVTPNEELRLTSAYITVLELLCEEMRATIKRDAGLTVTQYRVLLLLLATGEVPVRVKDVASVLHLNANVVTMAENVLERARLVGGVPFEADGRVRAVRATRAGEMRAMRVGEQLDSAFSALLDVGDDRLLWLAQEAIVTIGETFEASGGAILRGTTSSMFLSALVAVETSLQRSFDDKVGASFNECRILHHLAERGDPMRGIDLARTLRLPRNTITRCMDRLEARGWAQRRPGPGTRQSVLATLTLEGKVQGSAVIEVVERGAKSHLWSRLDTLHRAVVNHYPDLVLARDVPA